MRGETGTGEKTTVQMFHQFVKLERGPVNTAIIDLLKGNVYQAENSVIDALLDGRSEEIPEFMESARTDDLIIEIDKRCWMPTQGENPNPWRENYKEKRFNIELHVEEGIDLEMVLGRLKYHTIHRLVFYGQEMPKIPDRRPGLETTKKERDFDGCVRRACADGTFERVTDSTYRFNKKYNSCWGNRVAVTRDGKVRPCIHSTIVVGDIHTDDAAEILEQLEKYWYITKDKVEKCKDCELRHVCFDCREIARREGGNLFAANPRCHYDPYKGVWSE